MYEFNYKRPGAIDEAVAAVNDADDGKFLA